MTGQSAPRGQVLGNPKPARAHLQHLAGGESAQEGRDLVERPVSAAALAGVVEGIGPEAGDGLCRDLACQRRQRLGPFRLARRLARPDVDAERAEAGGAARLWGTAEDIGAPGDRKIDEASGDDRRPELCFQQSAGNSASPEVDLVFGTLRHCPLDQNVAKLQASARFEHARHLA